MADTVQPEPTLSSLLYVSRSVIPPEDSASAIREIVDVAQSRNAVLNVTGALLFTGTHFAQVLEGDDEAIEQLLASICRDPRHTDLRVVDRHAHRVRRYTNWTLAYCGPSPFVSRHVSRLLAQPSMPEHRRVAEWLAELLQEFSGSPSKVGEH